MTVEALDDVEVVMVERPALPEAESVATVAEALAWLDCRLYDKMRAGTHTIFVGEVVDGQPTMTGLDAADRRRADVRPAAQIPRGAEVTRPSRSRASGPRGRPSGHGRHVAPARDRREPGRRQRHRRPDDGGQPWWCSR